MGSLTYNSNNQKSGTGYAYDGNGNPTTYAGTSLGFDLESRLTAIGSSWSAGYRPDGLRGSKTVSSTTTSFLYDGATPVAELNSSGTITALNVFGADGLIGRVVPGGTDIQYLFDHQGNVAQRLNGSGSVISKSAYDAYGAESSTSTPTDPFGYNAQSGYYLDRETGLYLCTYRYYDPAKGRWLNRDPIGYAGGMNLYGYCGGGPVGGMDASGLSDSAPVEIIEAEVLLADELPEVTATGRQYLNKIPGWIRNMAGGAGAAASKLTGDPEFQEKSEYVLAECANFGRQIHGIVSEVVNKLSNVALSVNQRIPGSTLRPDVIDFENRIVAELKPNTSSGIQAGLSQLERYLKILDPSGEGGWRGILVPYNAPWHNLKFYLRR